MRRRARIDNNHRAIVQALTKAGATVCSLAPVGTGVPDLLIGVVAKSGPRAAVAEVKAEDGKLTDDQVRWRCWWIGPYVIFRSPEDALEWYQQERKK